MDQILFFVKSFFFIYRSKNKQTAYYDTHTGGNIYQYLWNLVQWAAGLPETASGQSNLRRTCILCNIVLGPRNLKRLNRLYQKNFVLTLIIKRFIEWYNLSRFWRFNKSEADNRKTKTDLKSTKNCMEDFYS